jgi:1-acyl-sn-glycerol-3-phosphate acyltransferase
MPVADLLAGCIRLVCGARPLSALELPAGPAIYFANHSSHLDFAIIWACLPKPIRERVRPVAGRDYWQKTALHRWLSQSVFHAVLIERQHVTVASNPLEPMLAALDAGYALIVFPEGTRSPDGAIREFKPGLFHLARARPALPLVPILLENLSRMLPKGDFLPVPLIAAVHLGPALHLQAGESRLDFLVRSRSAIVSLAEPASP